MTRPDDAPTETVPAAEPRDDGFDFDLDAEPPPPPPRRRRFPLVTAVLVLGAAVGAGVVLGILVQKHWGSSGSGGGRASAPAAALGNRAGQAAPTQAGGSRDGGGLLARSGTVGQVKAIDGTSLYITDLQGNTIKVTTGPGVLVRVTTDTTLKKVNPGDYVTVQGTQTAAGYKATSITDNGTESPFGGGAGGGGFGGAGSSSSGGRSSGGGQTSLPGLP